MKTIVSEHRKVVDFYTRNKDVFNYPGMEKAAKYAFIDIAKVMDARIIAENTNDLRSTTRQMGWDEEIGETMFMLMAALGLDDMDFNNSMRNIRSVLCRNYSDDIELVNRNMVPFETRISVEKAISEAGSSIAQAICGDEEFPRFTALIVNAIGVWDWSGDRMDRTIAKLEQRCWNQRNKLNMGASALFVTVQPYKG